MKFLSERAENVWNWMDAQERSTLLVEGRVHPCMMDAIMINTQWGIVCLTAEEILDAGSEEAALKAKTAHLEPFHGKSIADIIRDSVHKKLDEEGSIHTVKAEPTPATKMADKTLHHNAGFFPNKIGRIDVLPRYPGVWG